jgi:predicted regulator of Ras-like GTPase activity (Roadblock/LC7/MglB family)/CheY-like chemotaxis protein
LKKILIVIHDSILLTIFRIWLHNNKKNADVILVSHCLEASNILEKNEIETIIMDLEIEKFDGFDLLLFCMKNYSKIHLIILSEFLINNNAFFYSFNCLKKSSSLTQLKSLLKDIREKKVSFKNVEDIIIADFFQLIQMKRKTCLIEIKSENKTGFIYFYQGELFDAIYGEDKRESAFLNILNEKCDQLSFKSIATRNFSRHITTSLINLIKTYRIKHDSLHAIDEPNKENKKIIEADKLKSSLDDKAVNDEVLLITDGLIENEENEENEEIVTKTIDYPKLIIEKHPTTQSKKIESINSPKREIKVLDRSDKKSEDGTATPISNDKVEVVPIKSKFIGKEKMALQDCLNPLKDVDGYLASAIFDMSGEVLIQHNNSKYNISLLGANAISMINSSVKALKGSGLGKFNFIQVNTDRSIFGAVWAVEDHSVAAVLLEPNANIGLAKLVLAKVGEAGGSQLS